MNHILSGKKILMTIGTSLVVGSTIFNSSCGVLDLSVYNEFPSQRQLAWAELEQTAFVHFGLNTYTGREWGWGSEDPNLFNPINYNTDQWVETFKNAGLTQVVLTAKHHDGFCLWPTEYTNRCVKNSSNFQGGHGDVVRDVAASCRRYGLKFGVYLSPWDRSRADYGKPSYVTYYQNQLRELLTNYGEISEVWFDGAQGGTGYYGGAGPFTPPDDQNDPSLPRRKVDNKTYYHWADTYKMVRELQPNAVMSQGPDLRWCGNEDGTIGDPNWNTLSSPYPASSSNKQNGDEYGNYWEPAECDTSIYTNAAKNNNDWFYHQGESVVKSANHLFNDVYLQSVGKGAGLILNVPPNQDGLISQDAIHTLVEYKTLHDNAFKTLLGKSTNSHQINFVTSQHIDYVVIQENIGFGQNIESFKLQYLTSNGEWKDIGNYKTIGYKRIIKINNSIDTKEIRVMIIKTKYGHASGISSIAVYSSM